MNETRIYDVIRAPHFSEKAAIAGESNQYVFKIAADADKFEVKKAVEGLWNVKVEKVRTTNVKGKTKRFGQRFGQRSDWKKAYVTLAAGHEIDFAGNE